MTSGLEWKKKGVAALHESQNNIQSFLVSRVTSIYLTKNNCLYTLAINILCGLLNNCVDKPDGSELITVCSVIVLTCACLSCEYTRENI